MATKRRSKQPIQITNGPWTGCFQSWDVAPNPAQELFTGLNIVFRNTQAGLAALIRPGFQNLAQLGLTDGDTVDTESGVDLLAEDGTNLLLTDGQRTPQCVYQHTRLDGTNDPLLFVGGHMYRWNADPVSPVFTDITPTTLRIDPSARIYCTTFANLLIVTDGVNKPWTYDPASGTATSINMDSVPSAWNAYGPPAVYSAKLFFIVNTVAGIARRTDFVWSEEAQPTVGYQQTNYDDRWTFTQTNADPLYCLSATNSALYIFRQDSISAVYGSVNNTFRTTSTQDAISLTVGTTSPASVKKIGNRIWWLDRLGRPYRMIVGGQPESIWKQMEVGVDSSIAASTLSTSLLERWGHCGWHMELGVVAFVSWSVLSGLPSSSMYMFDDDSGTFFGAWQLGPAINGVYVAAMGLLRDINNRQRFVSLGADALDAGGQVYAHRLLASGGATYYQDLSTQIPAYVQTRMLGDDAMTESLFDRVDIELAGDSKQSSGNQQVVLTTGTQRAQPAGQTGLTASVLEGTSHVSFGLLERGRALRCTATINTTAATRVPEGFNRIVVTAYPDAPDPGVP